MSQTPPADRSPLSRATLDTAITVVLGLAGATGAAYLGSASGTVLGLGVLSLLGLMLFVWLRSSTVTGTLVVALVAFSIPINLDINPLYRPHTGGAPSITINVTMIALAIFFVVWFHRTRTGLQERTLQLHGPLVWSMLVLLAVAPLSAINADDLELVALEWFRLVSLGTAMVAAMSLRDERFARVWVFVLSLQVVLQAALAGAQYGLKQTLGLGIFGEAALVEQRIGVGTVANRATGTIGHPNILSYFFEILVPVMLALALARQRPVHRLWYGLACLAGLAGMVTTLTRGSWLTVPISMLMVVTLVVGPRIVRIRSAVGVGLLGLALAVPLYLVYPTIERRFTFTDYKSSGSRVPLNRAAWSIVEEHPIIGIGLNNMAEVFKREDSTGLARTFHGVQHVVHNLHLWIWAETGTLGLLAYLGPFVVAIWTALRTASRAPPVPRSILIGFATGLLAHLMHGMLDPGYRISLSVSMLVFTSFGLIGHLAMKYGQGRNPSAPVAHDRA